MKQVRERSNAKAWIILNKENKHVATVQALYTQSAVQVDVWGEYELIHQRKASGYGYDKFTAALSGLVIEGHKIFDHCGTDESTEKILKDYHSGKIKETTANLRARKIGASFANWNNITKKWGSLHYKSGLDRLTAFGFKIIQAI